MLRQYHASNRIMGGHNPLHIGTIAVGNIYRLQEDAYFRHQGIIKPNTREPWIIEAFPNGQYNAARRNPETGFWESIYAPNRTDTAILRNLRNGRRKIVTIWRLLIHDDEGFGAPENKYPTMPPEHLHPQRRWLKAA